jgi:short subunit dehydrogenase-like uncharacterized protein
MAVVANCAGPFATTSAPMIDACLNNQTHYLDITGEIDVFLAAHRRHIEAKTAGIVICPGVGFDVIPTDCMAATLKEALPDATHLALAFDAGGSMSPGTAHTMAQSMRLGQRGGRVRRSGVIEEVPLAHNWRLIDFAGGAAPAIAIPLGGPRYRLVLDRHSQHRDICRSAARGSDRQPGDQLGTALTRIGTWAGAATTTRQ